MTTEPEPGQRAFELAMDYERIVATARGEERVELTWDQLPGDARLAWARWEEAQRRRNGGQ